MRRFIEAAAQATADAARTAVQLGKCALDAAYSPTMQAKAAQGATEVANSIHTGNAFSPYTADNSYRAQFQNHDQAQGQER